MLVVHPLLYVSNHDIPNREQVIALLLNYKYLDGVKAVIVVDTED